MKLQFFFQKVALHCAVENENPDIIKLLLNAKDIDVNMKTVFHYCF